MPQRIEAEAAGHHRVAFEVAEEEPEVRLHIELGADDALAVLAALLGNFGDAVEHQHRRQRQLGVAGAEKFPAAAGQQIFVFEAMTLAFHRRDVPDLGTWLNFHAQIRNIPRLAGKDGAGP